MTEATRREKPAGGRCRQAPAPVPSAAQRGQEAAGGLSWGTVPVLSSSSSSRVGGDKWKEFSASTLISSKAGRTGKQNLAWSWFTFFFLRVNGLLSMLHVKVRSEGGI